MKGIFAVEAIGDYLVPPTPEPVKLTSDFAALLDFQTVTESLSNQAPDYVYAEMDLAQDPLLSQDRLKSGFACLRDQILDQTPIAAFTQEPSSVGVDILRGCLDRNISEIREKAEALQKDYRAKYDSLAVKTQEDFKSLIAELESIEVFIQNMDPVITGSKELFAYQESTKEFLNMRKVPIVPQFTELWKSYLGDAFGGAEKVFQSFVSKEFVTFLNSIANENFTTDELHPGVGYLPIALMIKEGKVREALQKLLDALISNRTTLMLDAPLPNLQTSLSFTKALNNYVKEVSYGQEMAKNTAQFLHGFLELTQKLYSCTAESERIKA